FGYTNDQARAANWLKPNTEDKNVSPWQLEQFVNTQVPELPVVSLYRYGGTLDKLKMLISNNFVVMIESGYDPERANQGWMGHYLLVVGYDDMQAQVITNDSYDGEGLAYTYAHIEEFWKHFNYMYFVIYDPAREAELFALLGEDADQRENYVNTFETARDQATLNPADAYAWFNMGSMLTELEQYENATIAFDQAFALGMPWRTTWYQFAPFEAYYAVGRYQDMLTMVDTLRDGSHDFVEEAFYYAGLARAALGETDRAITNFNAVLTFNPNFSPAREQIAQLSQTTP
ncbi:MAG TPA: hypothetical protein PLZ51_22965, partial [Aggregatilineales bacterium]|nr:hypothetical protein [Aggregatilineales bacterium]